MLFVGFASRRLIRLLLAHRALVRFCGLCVSRLALLRVHRAVLVGSSLWCLTRAAADAAAASVQVRQSDWAAGQSSPLPNKLTSSLKNTLGDESCHEPGVLGFNAGREAQMGG